MKLADLDLRPLVTLSPFSSTDQAVAAMAGSGLTCLLVLDQWRLAGLLTAAGMLESVAMLTLAERRRLGAPFSDEDLCVADVMETEVTCVGADMPPSDAARLLAADERLGALPVLADGRPVGLFTEADALRFMFDRGVLGVSSEGGDLVRHLARPASEMLAPTDTMRTICERFSRWRVWSLPVVEDGRLLGLVTVPLVRSAIDDGGDPWDALVAREIMAGDAPSVDLETPMPQAARLMLDHRNSLLPVTTREGDLIGLLTAGDALAACVGGLNACG